MQEYLEQIPHWLQNVSFFVLSLFKSYTGPSLSAVFDFSYSEMLIVNYSAAVVSILLSYRFRYLILILFKGKNRKGNGYSKQLKRSLKFWKKYGFIGISIIAPVLITIPLGVLIAAHFKTSKANIFIYMLISTFIWTNFFYFSISLGKSFF